MSINKHSLSFTNTSNCKTEAMFVYTHSTFELTQLMSALLLPFDIPLISITFQPMFPSEYVSNPLYVYSYEASFGRDIHLTGINNFRKQLNISVAAVLNLSGNRDNSLEDCLNQHNSGFCTYAGLLPSTSSCLKSGFTRGVA